jgi:hypothetical protein
VELVQVQFRAQAVRGETASSLLGGSTVVVDTTMEGVFGTGGSSGVVAFTFTTYSLYSANLSDQLNADDSSPFKQTHHRALKLAIGD